MDRKDAIKVLEAYFTYVVGDIIDGLEEGNSRSIDGPHICTHFMAVDLMDVHDITPEDLWVDADPWRRVLCREFATQTVTYKESLKVALDRMVSR